MPICKGRVYFLAFLAVACIFVLWSTFKHSASEVVCQKVDDYSSADFKCVHPMIGSNSTTGSYLVCVHPSVDWVSKILIDAKPIETITFDKLPQALDAFPEALFVDIGGFIGTHSLFAASRGHKTVTAEPFEKNLRLLRKSVELNCFGHLVTVVPNCVSNERGTHRFVQDPTCFACSFIDKKVPNATKVDTAADLECLLLDDVARIAENVSDEKFAIVKVDVEGHNSQVFTAATASRLFEKFDVPIVFMEWAHQNKKHSKSDVDMLVKFFTSRGYGAFGFSLAAGSPFLDRLKVEGAWDGWPVDIVWTKEASIEKLGWKAL